MIIWERLPGHRKTLSTHSPEGRKVIGKAVRIQRVLASVVITEQGWIRKAEWSSTHRERLWKFPSLLPCGARHCLGCSPFTLNSDSLKSGVDWEDVSVGNELATRAWRTQVQIPETHIDPDCSKCLLFLSNYYKMRVRVRKLPGSSRVRSPVVRSE